MHALYVTNCLNNSLSFSLFFSVSVSFTLWIADRPANRGRYGNFNNDERFDRNQDRDRERGQREGSFGNQSRDGDRYNNFSRHRDRERTHYNPNQQQPERPSGVSMGLIGKQSFI